MADQKGSDDRLSAQEFRQKYAKPVILAFQPERFKIVTEPRALQEWEQRLKTRVGFQAPDGFADHLRRIGTCCESDCPSLPQSGDNLDVDDCDAD